ncbi:hypothetical protein FMEAI12_2760002 [Parafrankia sp. Ea1.12]|nr:hypothetical protein FMEAI12_2760002 [Parafrankia sp. Ea1.12]
MSWPRSYAAPPTGTWRAARGRLPDIPTGTPDAAPDPGPYPSGTTVRTHTGPPVTVGTRDSTGHVSQG